MNISKGRFIIIVAAAFVCGIVVSLAASLGISALAGSGSATIEKYKTIDGVRYKTGDSNSNYIGINKLSVAIVWNFLNRTK